MWTHSPWHDVCSGHDQFDFFTVMDPSKRNGENRSKVVFCRQQMLDGYWMRNHFRCQWCKNVTCCIGNMMSCQTCFDPKQPYCLPKDTTDQILEETFICKECFETHLENPIAMDKFSACFGCQIGYFLSFGNQKDKNPFNPILYNYLKRFYINN